MDICVREISSIDSPIINKWHNDTNLFEDLVGNFYGPTMEETTKWIKKYNREKRKTFRGIVSSLNGQDIGIIYLLQHNKSNSAEVGIFIADEKYRSQGYGTEMMKWLLNFGLNILAFEKIYLYTLDTNQRAKNLYKKFGFLVDQSKSKIIIKNGSPKKIIYMFLKKHPTSK